MLILLWSYLGLYTLQHIQDLKNQVLFYMMFGTVTVNATLLWLLLLWKKSLSAWTSLIITLVRTLIVILTFKLIAQKAPSFDQMDPKRMHDTISFVAIPTLLLFAHNFKIELCLTVPLIVLANNWTINAAYIDQGSNMDGFADPEAYA